MVERPYNVDFDGKIDVNEIRGLVDSQTKALIVVSPISPQSITVCGNSLRDIFELAKELQIIVIFDNCLRLQIFEAGIDSTQEVFSLAKDVGVDMVYLGGVDESFGLQGYNFNWLVKFGKNLDKIWDHLKAFRLVTPGPSVITQRGFSEFMEHRGSDFQNIWASDFSYYEKVRKNVDYLRHELDRNGVVKIYNFNSTVFLTLILDLVKLGFEDDEELCREFMVQKKYKCLPLKKLCGGNSSGIRVCLTHNLEVYQGFAPALQDFIQKRISATQDPSKIIPQATTQQVSQHMISPRTETIVSPKDVTRIPTTENLSAARKR